MVNCEFNSHWRQFYFCWNLLKALNVNFVQKCQICVICKNLDSIIYKILDKKIPYCAIEVSGSIAKTEGFKKSILVLTKNNCLLQARFFLKEHTSLESQTNSCFLHMWVKKSSWHFKGLNLDNIYATNLKPTFIDNLFLSHPFLLPCFYSPTRHWPVFYDRQPLLVPEASVNFDSRF